MSQASLRGFGLVTPRTKRSMVRVLIIGSILSYSWTAFSVPAFAEPAGYLIDSNKVALEESAEGESSGKVMITNLTTAAGTYQLAIATPDDGCTIEPRTGLVEAATKTSISFNLSVGCDIPPDGKGIVLSFDGQALTFNLVAAPDKQPPFQWTAVGAPFGYAAVLFAFTFIGIFWRFGKTSGDWKPNAALPSLPATWSFKDSWVTIATLVTAAFSGVFGSTEIVKVLTGESDVSDILANVTVGGALAVGLIAAAPILLLSMRTGGDKGQNTVGGVLVASWLVLTATSGQLGVIIYAAAAFVPILSLLVASVVAAGILLLYAVRSTLLNLRQGIVEPTKAAIVEATDGSSNRYYYPGPDYGWLGLGRGDTPAVLP